MFTVRANNRHLYSDGSETEDPESNYRGPLEIFVPVSYQTIQPINHRKIPSSFSKSKSTEYNNSPVAKYPIAIIGPYKLGETVVLRCVSRGGHPLPNVTWWKDNSVLGTY